ncbi:MAG TPA: YbhB/YbcL family Raf kinase inhibitor-like protein [Hanamia sp.]|nr:YbhB/YbcL family Raf kinase inhibitor-like protein [Hanamia sp.]
MDPQTNKLKVSSPAFQNEGEIPSKYTCDGEGINPPLRIENIPEDTKTLALIVEDPDAPNGVFDHWLVWNINPVSIINEKSLPGTSGDNSAGKSGYHPPCPPNGSHRYYFYVFALDKALDILAGANKQLLLEAMDGHVIAKGSLMGRYERKK